MCFHPTWSLRWWCWCTGCTGCAWWEDFNGSDGRGVSRFTPAPLECPEHHRDVSPLSLQPPQDQSGLLVGGIEHWRHLACRDALKAEFCRAVCEVVYLYDPAWGHVLQGGPFNEPCDCDFLWSLRGLKRFGGGGEGTLYVCVCACMCVCMRVCVCV